MLVEVYCFRSSVSSFWTSERVGLAVTLHTCIRDLLGQDIGYLQVAHGFLQYLEANLVTVSRFCDDHLLPNPFQFNIH